MTNCYEYALLKKDLLCFGMRISAKAYKFIELNHLYMKHSKYVHPAIFQFEDGTYVNITIEEQFSNKSPYLLDICGDNLILVKDDVVRCKIFMKKTPIWCDHYTSDGHRMSDVVSIHGANTLAFSSHNSCRYKKDNEGCLFCTSDFNDNTSAKVQARQICEILYEAAQEKLVYSLALSGGTRYGDDAGLCYFIELIKDVKTNFPDLKISVESVAPDNLGYIGEVIDAGASSLIMNLELYSDLYRKHYCPGKARISKEHYFDAYKKAVEKLGKWNCASVLIAGLEPAEETIEGAKKMLDVGITPTIMPFRPYDCCMINNKKVTDPRTLDRIEDAIRSYMLRNNIKPHKSEACLKCNACIAIELWK